MPTMTDAAKSPDQKLCSRWLLPAWVLWWAASIVACASGAWGGLEVMGIRHNQQAVFLAGAGVFFIAFLQPVWLRVQSGRLAVGKGMFGLIILVGGLGIFGLALASRIAPMPAAALLPVAAILFSFLLFTYTLYQVTRRWYMGVVVLLNCGIPLLVYVLRDLVLGRAADSRALGVWLATSVFTGMVDALAPQIPPLGEGATWQLCAIVQMLGMAACLCIGPRQQQGHSPVTKKSPAEALTQS